jgi:hypothetical protein
MSIMKQRYALPESRGPLPDPIFEANKSTKPSEMDPEGESDKNELSRFELHLQKRCEAAELYVRRSKQS